MSPSAHISEVPLVLIVDDDVSVRRSTERLIRSLGMRAESFASARHLLSSEDSIEADCLLIDIRMPGIDGLQLLRRLRANSQRTQVIFFSGRATQEEEDRALRAGALAFVRKPVCKDALLRLIEMALEELGVESREQSTTVLHLDDPQVRPEGLRNYLLGHGVRTLLTIPLISRGELNGVLGFRFAEERDFQAEELEIARALATQASLAIHLTQLAKSAKRSAVLQERNRLAGEIHD